MEPVDLIKHAIKAQKNSQSQYSNFPVGCALISDDNSIIYGCNIESAVYPSTLCAERVAIYSALSQGLKKSLIYYRLALKNALLPPITQIAVIWGDLIGTAVIIEIVFSWPGVGNWSIDAALAGDFAPVQALAMIAAASNVIIFLITEPERFI